MTTTTAISSNLLRELNSFTLKLETYKRLKKTATREKLEFYNFMIEINEEVIKKIQQKLIEKKVNNKKFKFIYE